MRTYRDSNPLVIFADIITFGVFSLTGIPAEKFESTSILDLKLNPYGIPMKTYIGKGNAYTACYYGYHTKDTAFQSQSNSLYDAFQKIIADEINVENQKKLKDAIEYEKIKNKIELENVEKILKSNKQNKIKDVITNAWTIDISEDRLKTHKEQQQDRNKKISKFSNWVKKKNGNEYLIFLDDIYFDYSDKFKYDPYTETLSINTEDISTVIKTTETKKWGKSKLKSNAFGAVIKVDNEDVTYYESDFENSINKNIKIKISANDLKNIKNFLKFVFVVKSNGEYKKDHKYFLATFDSPYDSSVDEYKLSGKVHNIYLYDSKNKKILRELAK